MWFERLFVATPIIIVIAILWLITFYFDAAGAVVFSILLSLVVAFFATILLSLGRRADSVRGFGIYILSFGICLGLMLFMSFGLWHLAQFSHTGVLETRAFYPWLGILLGVPTLYFGPGAARRYFSLLIRAKLYINIRTYICHPNDLPVYIDELSFIRSKNNKRTAVQILKYEGEFYPANTSDEETIRSRRQDPNRFIVNEAYDIPVRCDRLSIAWYSFAEQKYYQGECALPLEAFDYYNDSHDSEGKRIAFHHLQQWTSQGGLSIRIEPLGVVSLFKYHTLLVRHSGFAEQAVTAEQQQHFLQQYAARKGHVGPIDTFNALLEQLRNSGRLDRLTALHTRTFNWALRFEHLHDTSRLEITDVTYREYRSKLPDIAQPEPRPLPEKIEIMYLDQQGHNRGTWLTLYIDTDALYQSVQALLGDRFDATVQMHISIRYDGDPPAHFTLSVDEHSAPFTAFSSRLDETRKTEALANAKAADERKRKLAALNEAWDDARNKNYTLAQQKCDALAAQTPVIPEIYFLKAYLLWHSEGFEAYMAKHGRILEEAGDHQWALSRVHNITGCALDAEQRYAEAMPYFEKAAALQPEDSNYVANLAEMHFKLGHAKQALDYAQRAQKMNHQSEILETIFKHQGKQP